MQIAQYIVDEARQIVQKGTTSFPAQLKAANTFFVSPQQGCDTKTLQVHSTFEEEGVIYVIATKK